MTSVPVFTGTDNDRIAAYTRLNAVRSQCGSGLLAQNTQLETSAQNHSNYIGSNYAAHPDAYSHVETAAYLNFTGAQPTDRDALVGYGALGSGEDLGVVLSSNATPQLEAIEVLLQTVYHLKSIFGAGNYDMGVAKAVLTPGASGATEVTVEFGSKLSTLQDIASNAIISYPCNGSITRTSPPVNGETPNPIPGRTTAIGAPIYVRVRVGQALVVSSFTLATSAGATVAPAAVLTKANDPAAILDINEAVFIPNVPLTATTTYVATVVGTNAGVAFTKTITFTTT